MKIKKRIIEIEVNDEFITGSGVVLGAAGSHNDVVIRARFNENWVGLNIVAIFKDANGENPTAIPVVMSSVSTLKESDPEYEVHEFTVPFGVKKYEGRVSLAFLGYNVAAVVEDEEQAYTEEAVMSSGTSYFNVLQSDVIMADDLYPEANPGQQLHKDVNTLEDMYGHLDDALEAILEIQGSLDDTTITIADLGTLEANIEKAKNDIVKLEDFLKYTQPEPDDNIFLHCYPIGSIYMSVNPTDPAYLFGGSWVALKDRFLVGAGGSYGVTSQGGATSHKHGSGTLGATVTMSNASILISSIQQKDGINHKPTAKINASTRDEYSQTTDWIVPVIGNTADTNYLPPYYAVYMWRREA